MSDERKKKYQIKKETRTFYWCGSKRYFSLLGACRHLARIKIMQRLGDYFREMGEAERDVANETFPGHRPMETHEQFEARVFPSKTRYKVMRERLALRIYGRLKDVIK